MRNVELRKLLPKAAAPLEPGSPALAGAPPPLLSVLWARRVTFAATVAACVLLAALYLLVASPVYRATSIIFVQQNAPRALDERGGGQALSDTYLQTQSDVIQSTPVLVRALEAVHYGKLHSFEGGGNPVAWLRRGHLDVDVVKRSDVINVSIESRFPDEAALLADGVVSAYVAEQADKARETATEMVRVLRAEKEQLQARREQALAAMLEAQRDGGVPTFRDGKGSIVLGRLDTLSSSLTAAEQATIEARSEQEAILAAMDGGEAMQAYVEGLQFKGRDFGDREYDELRTRLAEQTAQLTAAMRVLGAKHPRVREQQASISSLREQVARKVEAIAEAQLAAATARLEAAQQKEAELRAALDAQKARALDASPAAARYARLEAEVLDVQKRCELIDNRIAELNVNSIAAAPFNVRVLQRAMVPDKPVKPNKALTLAAALLAGCVLGIGFAAVREWKDARLRAPEEIQSLLGIPLVGIVPQMNRRLSAVDRGQVVRIDSRSPVAEAYRSIRTTLCLGDARSAKTVLIASASSGDGKSTTAANLAIAFAQAGERTLLIDCNLREPVQHMIFEVEGSAGVTTAMTGESKLKEAVVPTRVPNLHLLPCGPVPRNPVELLSSDRFKHLLKTLGEAFERIVIDSPALEQVADGRVLAACSDVTVLVARMNQSMRRSGTLALSGLDEVGASVLGAVANAAPRVAAARLNAGPWQYAAARRVIIESGTVGIGTMPQGELPALPNADVPFRGDEVSIAELQWPAERP
jgi:capsular exopolysaccharide synthesis family protein